jgi:hypothetical protein
MVTPSLVIMPEKTADYNRLAKRANQNIFQTVLLEAADITQYRLFIQPLYELPNLGQDRVPQKVLRRFLKACSRVVEHIRMAQYVSQIRQGYDAVLFTHFLNFPIFLTFLFSGLQPNRVYLLSHYMQQVFRNRLYFWLFKLYIWKGYRFLVFEDADLLARAGFSAQELRAFVSIPHPVLAHPQLKQSISLGHRKRVGLIGEVRDEKHVPETIAWLSNLQEELKFDLVIGTKNISFFQELSLGSRATFIDTTTNEGYFAALSACDVIVLNYEKRNYFMRASGVIADAIGTRTYCICPNYPVMRRQILWPVPIGDVFDDLANLGHALGEILTWPDPKTNPAFNQHAQERSAHVIAGIIDAAIKDDR